MSSSATYAEILPGRQPKCACGESDPSKFYGHKKSICGACHNKYTIEVGRKTRRRILEHMGGKCVSCGFNKYITAMDIHHLDPSIKDKNFSSYRGWSWDRILKEIENCILLCRNCHGAVHSGELTLT